MDIQKCINDSAYLYETYLANKDSYATKEEFIAEVSRRSRGRVTKGALRGRLKKQKEVMRVISIEEENKVLKNRINELIEQQIKDKEAMVKLLAKCESALQEN